MNFKKLAEQKIDELSGKKQFVNMSIESILETLDETVSELQTTKDTFDIELQNVENLFDGYLGEQKDVPNPLEYGPNATYRNLREGIVYKKNSKNLWEAFLKDGQNGRNGQSAPGGGCGVSEVISIIEKYGQTPFNMNKNSEGNYETITISVSAGQYITSALPIGPSYLFQYSGIGPFAIKTGSGSVVATSNDLPTFSGLREILYIKDTHISLYGIGPGSVTIVGGVGV